MQRKVCWHNWTKSPDHDACVPDGINCVMVDDDQTVVCQHTGFREPCPAPNKCRIDNVVSIVLKRGQKVVCWHQKYADFGFPNNPSCDCAKIDGVNVRMAPTMIKCSNRHNWTPCTDACGCGAPDGESVVYLAETEQVVAWQTDLRGRLDDPTLKVSGTIDGLNCFIRDTSQTIRWLPGKDIRDYRRTIDNWFNSGWKTDDGDYKLDPFASVCKLNNREFPKKMTADLWKQTAVVVMDVWDRHSDPGASSRLQELAPAVDAFVKKARDSGAMIIHSPSTLGNLYTDPTRADAAARQARKNALCAAAGEETVRRQFYYLGLVTGQYIGIANIPGRGMFFDEIVYPADDAPPASPNAMGVKNGSPQRQHPAISIQSDDFVSAERLDGCDANREILALTRARPYIIYVGTATNWCILRRCNGMRSMYKAGKSLWLVRDLTDPVAGDKENGAVQGLTEGAAFLTQDQGPNHKPVLPYTQEHGAISHFRGTDLIVDWIGWNMPGTRTDTRDTEFPELGRYRFPGD